MAEQTELEEVKEYLNRRKQMRGIHPEEIHTIGGNPDVTIRASTLEGMLAQLSHQAEVIENARKRISRLEAEKVESAEYWQARLNLETTRGRLSSSEYREALDELEAPAGLSPRMRLLQGPIELDYDPDEQLTGQLAPASEDPIVL